MYLARGPPTFALIYPIIRQFPPPPSRETEDISPFSKLMSAIDQTSTTTTTTTPSLFVPTTKENSVERVYLITTVMDNPLTTPRQRAKLMECLVEIWAETGEISRAVEVVKEMSQLGFNLGGEAFNKLIAACKKAGEIKLAAELHARFGHERKSFMSFLQHSLSEI